MQRDAFIFELEEQLKFKDFELNAILEITKAIHANQSVDHLLSIYEFILREQLRLHSYLLFVQQDKWEFLLKHGVKLKAKELTVTETLLRFKEVTLISSTQDELLNAFEIVIPFIHKGKQIAFLLFKRSDKRVFDSKLSAFNDVQFIQTITNLLVVAIENQRMAKESLMQERIKKELEVASEMQKMLFPAVLPSDRRMDMAAKYEARHEVGGDYYDFIPINEDEFIICIGDVSGKGVGAAMLMANFQAMIRTLIGLKTWEFKELLPELNRKVMEIAKGEKFITFFIGHYNKNSRLFKYVNAGHNYPILTNGQRALFLNKGTVGLGMMEELPFLEPSEIIIEPRSTLILYTDGVVELQNKSGDYFKTDRLIKLIHSFYPLNMEDLNSLLFSKLNEFRGEEEFVDDTAIFSCRIF